MATKNKLIKLEIKDPHKIIFVVCDAITKNENNVVIKTERIRETLVPNEDITNKLNALNLIDNEKQQVTDLSIENWTDEVKSSYVSVMEAEANEILNGVKL
mgnify:CR=1 FL=1